MEAPSLDAQGEYWGEWGVESARGEGKGDVYDDRVCQLVREVALRCASRERAADVGCGTGWITRVLEASFEHVWATELAPASIRVARQASPKAEFFEGDFLALELPAPVDLTVTCEVVAHVRDQPAFFARCRELTKLGGRLLVLTQNPVTWSRNSYAHPANPKQLRHWLSRADVRALCEGADFRVESIRTLEPMGDKGLLWWRPYAQGALRRVIGRERAKAFFEWLRLGRTLVIEAVAV
ncbi:MAG TPA: class I SAM-dependent methyltransferase [Polyangiaceae bacterium]|nr:class I SAM-dependent methyltransferase [Polyangiaceae bacterium]